MKKDYIKQLIHESATKVCREHRRVKQDCNSIERRTKID